MQISTENIIKLIVFITVFFMIVAFFVFAYVRLYNQKKKRDAEEKLSMQKEFENQLLRSRIEVQETTLSTLGRELHDNIGQLLSTTKMLLGLSERSMPQQPDSFTTAQNTLGQAIQELRALSKSLDKEWLEQFSFTDNIRTEINRINASQELTVHFQQEHRLLLSADKQIILFRIVQEAMQNSIKHAAARNIYIRLSKTRSDVDVTITDDGRGMTGETSRKGMGLFNMQQRAKLLGGTIQWQPAAGTGTVVSIQIPENEQHEN